MPRPDVAAREWVQDVLAHNGPIYLRIVNSLERTVRRGGLAPGQRLPSQRALAQQLGIDLTTVTRAFDEARKRGLIEARGPQGSFIAPPKAGFDQVVDLSMNVPPV
ncbi:GntR family transcriptional regulator, partial [Escherichia coli]